MYMIKRNENIHPQNILYINIYSSTTHSSQTVELIQISNKLMNKCIKCNITIKWNIIQPLKKNEVLIYATA